MATTWNSPIYWYTDGYAGGSVYQANRARMKLNGTFVPGSQYPINGFNSPQGVNTSGYLLLGNNNNSISDGQSIFNQKGAFSLLHLNGETASNGYQEFGYRPWMKTGVTFTGNRDLSYMGLRQIGTDEDITETTLVWSDNGGTSNPGPDDLSFRFTSGGGNNSISSINLQTPTDLDGLHVARFTPEGLFGLGNTFGVNTTGTPIDLYVRPASLAHYSLSNNRSVWQQFTNRNILLNTGTGELATDGFRLGILGNDSLNRNGIALVYNQENRPLLLSANANTNNVNGFTTNERLRIMAYNTPTVLPTVPATYGFYNPAPDSIPNNITRMSISHNPLSPVTRPLSLLHLGYNTGSILNPNSTDGWRSWMDVGMFVAQGTDNVFLGLKREPSLNPFQPDRYDAVLNWGDNQVPDLINGAGPDNLRFIFTSTTTATFGVGDSISQSFNGLETGRFYPGLDTTFTYLLPDSIDLYGRFGVGDFTASGVNENPTHKLDVIGNGRFRYLPDSLYVADSTVNKIVMVDSMGVLRWASFSPVSLGASCADTVNGKLAFNTKIDLNNYNFYFVNNDSTTVNHVGVGYDCSTDLPGKLSVYQWHPDTLTINSTAVHAINEDVSSGIDGSIHTAVLGHALGTPTNFDVYRVNRGGDFFGTNSFYNNGILAYALDGAYSQSVNEAGVFRAWGGERAWGIHSVASSATGENTGIRAIGSYGLDAYGIFAEANMATNNYSAYFSGAGVSGSDWFWLSDSTLKSNVLEEQNLLPLMSKLRPVNYMMNTTDYDYMNLSGNLQHGFISQEVQTIFPELVQTVVYPAKYDSLGVEISPRTEALGLNYNGFISLNTQAIIELNRKVENQTLSDESLKVDVVDLENSLSKILDLRGVTYDWNSGAIDSLQLDHNTHIGFIAQEVHEVDSLLTYTDDLDFVHVDYAKVVPILVEAVQEMNEIIENQATTIAELENSVLSQQNEINDLNARLTTLENCLSGILPFLCQMNHTMIAPTQEEIQEQLRSHIDVELNNAQTIVLDQNVPNPFAETTTINYTIPESVQRAQIHFYDAGGNLIKTVDITERGEGQLNVFAQDLSSGVYTYSLVADGKHIATKRMVKQ